MRTTERTRSTSAGLPNPRTADVRDPPGPTVPAGFPFTMLENDRAITSTAALGYAPLATFARPYDAETIASHRSSQCAPERPVLRPVRQGPPHDAHGRSGPVHQRRRRRRLLSR